MSLDDRMLKEMSLRSVDELFADIPEGVRIQGIDLPPGISEMEVIRTIKSMLSSNLSADTNPCFVGAGVYHHFIPSAVRTIVSRSEFTTSYTPYQPEISQGVLQSLFEYQSFVAELTGLEAVNSSNYDGATALGEAATMCHRLTTKSKFFVPEAMSWEKASVLQNYLKGSGMELLTYGYDETTGEASLEELRAGVDADTAGVYIEVPNFFGIIDRNAPRLKAEFKEVPLVVGVNPISLGILTPPGEYGADIVIGEGQVLGSPMNFGGPLLGLFATKQEHVRKMPGRVIGMTKDSQGKRAFCMTLQTREQHIRRSKATSNICSNEALMAIAASAYLSILGKEGLRTLARMNIARARELMNSIADIKGFESPLFDAYHFNEFVIKPPVKPEKLNKVLFRKGMIGGLPLGEHIGDLADCMLLCTTEMNSDEDHRRLITALEEIV